MSILADTLQRNKPSELIYWNKECICKNSNRNFQDNVANLFLPQLMKIKGLLSALQEDLAQHQAWIQAKLCDGEDEASEELRAAHPAHDHKWPIPMASLLCGSVSPTY